ncbi:MAG: monooxygenase family protein [Methylophilaceae bacterium]
MKTPIERRTVDLSDYPNLVVIFLGIKVNVLTGIKTIIGIGPQIQKASDVQPEGLLYAQNNIILSLFPLQIGMRWYWKDFDSMERWARSDIHRKWWQNFIKNSGGTGFWHETYFMQGGMEAVYDNMTPPNTGFMNFAPIIPAKGGMFSARSRNKVPGAGALQPEGTSEQEIYGN